MGGAIAESIPEDAGLFAPAFFRLTIMGEAS